jgi:glycosyltransferase involved in cell wall biosynthesis
MEKKTNLNFDFFKTIDLILPAYNEEASIRKCIEEFESINLFTEIIVVDNNSSDNTANEIKKTQAKYILEQEQGYGSALMSGMKQSSSDIIITCEPDLTFSHLDVYKLLIYLKDFDCVFGTRTSKSMIGVGSKMYSYLRYGNILVAKLLEYLFHGPSITDVGCSYKAFKRKSIIEILPNLTVKGSHFQPELMIRLIQSKNKIIEIPVYYLKRVGYSKITYSFYSSLRVALNMIKIIFYIYFTKIFKKK